MILEGKLSSILYFIRRCLSIPIVSLPPQNLVQIQSQKSESHRISVRRNIKTQKKNQK